MMPELRRTISLLRSTPRGERVTVHDETGGEHPCLMGAVAENENAVEFTTADGGRVSHALDQIQKVWRTETVWRVFTQK
jgi:hypothetical protein